MLAYDYLLSLFTGSNAAAVICSPMSPARRASARDQTPASLEPHPNDRHTRSRPFISHLSQSYSTAEQCPQTEGKCAGSSRPAQAGIVRLFYLGPMMVNP